MADTINPEYTYEGRLASFKKAGPGPKRRGSAASGRGTKGGAGAWPHAKFLPAEQLARAGFSWRPSAEFPDNVCCFICSKNLGGWESGDDALEEHIKHAPHCGWAIVAAIESGYGGYPRMDPGDAAMIEARKATFAGVWPHEGKRGWKCKVKQLAEAGWKWTPTLEYDDMATCTYCDLMLDGWEQGDKPLDEHKKRSPDCPFFALMEEYKPLRKAKGKGGRTSKASRASVQSVSHVDFDTTSMADDLPAENDDTVMTTTSTTGAKKGRAKKTTTAKGRKTKAKKDEPVEVEEDTIAEEEPPAPPPKPTRGRKRASDAIDESVITNAEAPAPKKRATKAARTSRAVDNSVVEESHMDVDSEPAPKARGRKPTRASNTRKASGKSSRSHASTASVQTAPGAFPDDDDEIDRQLEADLERPLTDDEDIMHDSDSERKKTTGKAKVKKGPSSKATKGSEGSKIWLDPDHEVDDADVEEDIQRLEEQIAAEQAAAAAAAKEEEEAALVVPKKGRKAAGTRKVSKPTKAQKAKEAEEAAARAAQEEAERVAREEADRARAEAEALAKAEAEAEAESHRQGQLDIPDVEDDEEVSLVPEPSPMKEDEISTATVTRHTEKPRTSTGRKRGRPSKAEVAARLSAQQAEHERARAAAEAEAAQVAARETVEPDSFASAQESPEPAAPTPPPKQMPARKDKSLPPPPSPAPPASVQRPIQHIPTTPRHQASPAQSARQAAVSPSPSPQASDAENQPPSARPAPATLKRVALAPIAATPARSGSPSKRNVLAGLRSTTPWTAVDVDMILSSPNRAEADKENGVDHILARGSGLTSPEKRMTVEQWIYHNAEQAETKLKHECESMVSKFEQEGSRAMNVLEGMIVD